jgi:peptide methionine sulfoxide reductase MsrA
VFHGRARRGGGRRPSRAAPRQCESPGPPQTAVIAGGCFWGVQGVYRHVRGVQSVLSGYAGGTQMERSKVFAGPIVTRVDPLDAFYRAEAYRSVP